MRNTNERSLVQLLQANPSPTEATGNITQTAIHSYLPRFQNLTKTPLSP